MKFREFLIESNEITHEYVLSLNIPQRKPRGVANVEHEVMLKLRDIAW